MYFRRDECTRTVRAPAKLNLYLDIVGRRGDGFHELETLVVPVRWWDTLSFQATPAQSDSRGAPISLTICGSFPARFTALQTLPPADESNLVVRALQALREQSGCTAGAHIELVKRIPLEAGLGGGSSDAAAALEVANRVWSLGWSRERLSELGAKIGSDVPFFLRGGAAVCRGRGERVERFGPMPRLHFVIVKPPGSLKTAAVYEAYDSLAPRAIRSTGSRLEELISALTRGRYGAVGRLMTNGLEAAAAALSPWVARVRAIFAKLDCLGHQMSGSGSSYFAICRHAQQARRIAAFLRSHHLGLVYATSSTQ